MLDISDEAASVMSFSGFTMRTRVESWLADDQLDADIPVASGIENIDVTLNVPESLSINVPSYNFGTSYVPGDAIDAPLACWGQRLRVSLGVDISSGTEWFGRTWYYITDSAVDGDTVAVQAQGLLGLLAEAQLISPLTASGTYQSQIQALVEPALTCDFTNSPADASVPSGTVWDANTSRLDAISELASTWGADYFTDEDGTLQFITATDTAVSSLTFTDGTGGTAMRWGTDVTRDGAYNVVVAQGTTAAGDQIQAVAYDNNAGSPTEFGGNFSVLAVPYFFYSPLLTTVAQCQLAANTILRNKMIKASRKITTSAVPYLALQVRDGVTVTAENLSISNAFGIIDQLSMPLTPLDGAMTLGVRIPNG